MRNEHEAAFSRLGFLQDLEKPRQKLFEDGALFLNAFLQATETKTCDAAEHRPLMLAYFFGGFICAQCGLLARHTKRPPNAGIIGRGGEVGKMLKIFCSGFWWG